LLALGLREFSMHPAQLLEVKQVITETNISRARAALTHWLNESGTEVDVPLLQLLDQSQQSQ
jgi:phosphoenolpyruvate-protein kinase (PTS system EI component)